MTTQEFFKKYTLRSQFIELLGLGKERGHSGFTHDPRSFIELQAAAATAVLGKEVTDSDKFNNDFLNHRISILERCNKRDTDNYLSMTRSQKRKSLIPECVMDNRGLIEELKKLLVPLKTETETESGCENCEYTDCMYKE